MKAQIIKSSDIKITDKGVLKVQNYFNKQELENMSMALITLEGQNEFTINKDFDSMYYILEGEGSFILDGEVNSVKMGDLVVIPRGVRYKDKGVMKMVCFNSPRWR